MQSKKNLGQDAISLNQTGLAKIDRGFGEW